MLRNLWVPVTSALDIPEGLILCNALSLGDGMVSLEVCPLGLIDALVLILGLGTTWTSVTGWAFIASIANNLFVPSDSAVIIAACLILLNKELVFDSTCPLDIDDG